MNRSVVALDRAIIGILEHNERRTTPTLFTLRTLRQALIRGTWPTRMYAWRRAVDPRTKTLILARLLVLARTGKIRVRRIDGTDFYQARRLRRDLLRAARQQSSSTPR